MNDFLPSTPRAISEAQATQMSVGTLAFIGDAVQTLYERTLAASIHTAKAGALHHIVSKRVNAKRQSVAAQTIESMLSEKEQGIYRRGKNNKTHNAPKHSTQGQYREASGFEALIGYLYLTGQNERLQTIFDSAYADNEDKQGELK